MKIIHYCKYSKTKRAFDDLWSQYAAAYAVDIRNKSEEVGLIVDIFYDAFQKQYMFVLTDTACLEWLVPMEYVGIVEWRRK